VSSHNGSAKAFLHRLTLERHAVVATTLVQVRGEIVQLVDTLSTGSAGPGTVNSGARPRWPPTWWTRRTGTRWRRAPRHSALAGVKVGNIDWSHPSSYEEARARLIGRRRFNERRQALARARQQQVWELLLVWGEYRGVQARIALELRVDKSTVCRDVARLRQSLAWW
jgi:hypothetical protein